VDINGVPSACSAAPGPGSCTFSYSAAATPAVASVSPTSATFTSDPTSITITASDLSPVAADNQIEVGGWPCSNAVVTATDTATGRATELSCQLSQSTPSGSWTVGVTVAGKGRASSAAQISITNLWIRDVQPADIPAGALTVVNITGGGFDFNICSRQSVTIAGQPSSVLGCGPGYVTVLYAAPSNAASSVPVAMTLQDANGTVYTASLANSAVTISAAAPSMSDVVQPQETSTAGTNVTFQASGSLQLADIKAVTLLPAFTNLTAAVGNASDLSSTAAQALASAVPCRGIYAGGSPGEFICSTGVLPAGSFFLMITTTDGNNITTQTVYTDTKLTFDLAISSVQPALGSVGGGTLVTISGTGFSSVAGSNVVLLHVPVSSTFINGMVLCDVEAATNAEIKCRTRAHLATDASADDPDAKQVKALSTPPE
jgi:hypothetical protein